MKKNIDSGNLHCPICRDYLKPKIKEIEQVGPYIKRYKCMNCGLTFRHDRTPPAVFGNPYRTFIKGLKSIAPLIERR